MIHTASDVFSLLDAFAKKKALHPKGGRGKSVSKVSISTLKTRKKVFLKNPV